MPAKEPPKLLQALEWFFLFCLLFGGFLWMRGPAKNPAQLMFRVGLSGVGLAGVIVVQAIKFMNR
jgi:hypothetical protein